MNMIIAIDHGNSEIKTEHERFVAGFKAFTTEPLSMNGNDTLRWQGEWYALSDERLPYRQNKAQDDDYFILTLFAIGKELVRTNIIGGDIDLAVGLPPAYVKRLAKPFEEYLRRNVTFLFAGREYHISIGSVMVFPQCWAAVVPRLNEIAQMQSCILVDIGGYTVDVIKLKHGRPDVASIHSLPRGVIKLVAAIREEIEVISGDSPDDSLILDLIAGKPSTLPADEREIIQKRTEQYVDELGTQLADEIYINARRQPVFYIGGGASLLKNYLPTGETITVIDDPLANAKGYAIAAAARAGQ